MPGGARTGRYLVFLLALLLKILWLIPIAILVFFIWRVIATSKQLDRIEALLLKNRRLAYERKESG